VPAFRKLRQKDGKFERILGYILSSRPAWATQRVPDQLGLCSEILFQNNNKKII
jgi:hypothetical protein